MRFASLAQLVVRDVRRSRGALTTATFGIFAGTTALVFFLALGLGVRAVLLGEVFPLDRVELEPRLTQEPGLLDMLWGGSRAPRGIPQRTVAKIQAVPGVTAVHPKLRFAFPTGAFGGKEIIGHDVGTHEMLADGVAPELVAGDVKGPNKFEDPMQRATAVCRVDADCTSPNYCEIASTAKQGLCSAPVPVLVSRYLVEVFNKGLAPAHGYPPVGMSLISRAEGITFELELGVSLLGRAKQGSPRRVKARAVGVSSSAIDLGITVPLDVVRRWNREYAGDTAADEFSSLLVKVASPTDVARVVAVGSDDALDPKDTRARDVSLLVNGIIALLSLVSIAMLVVAASNIAFTFRVLIHDRRSEIGLYRALGATPTDIKNWIRHARNPRWLGGLSARRVCLSSTRRGSRQARRHESAGLPVQAGIVFPLPVVADRRSDAVRRWFRIRGCVGVGSASVATRSIACAHRVVR
ncbi:MAG: ABC transporter permease [Polyangiaceae bacterium]